MAESNKLTFENMKITEQEIKANGIQALANRPNKSSQYGKSGLSASELKLWFDNLTSLIAKRVNGIANALESADSSKYISVVLPEEFAQLRINTLYDLIKSIYNGKFASILNVPIDSSNSSLESHILNILTSLSEVSSTASEAKETADDAKETADEFEGDIEDLYLRLEEYYGIFANARLTYDKEKSQLVYSFWDQSGFYEAKKADLPIKDLEHRLDQLESATLQFTEESTVAYESIVPANSAKYALVNKVGGMTYKSNNPLRPIWSSSGDGVVTVNADNSITVKGYIQAGNAAIHLINQDEDYSGFVSFGTELPEGVRMHYSYYSDDFFDETDDSSVGTYSAIYSHNGKTYSHYLEFTENGNYNFTLYPMVSESATAPKYEPYYEGLRDAKVTELVSVGANLIPRATRNAQTINGVTFTVQEDNSIIANGTATADTAFEILRGGAGEKISINVGETYTLSGCPKGGLTSSYRLVVQSTNYSQNYNDAGDGVTDIAKFTDYYAFIRISAGYTANNLVFKPMFNRGSAAQPYSPYGAIVGTFKIKPELIAYLEPLGYGRGVNAEYNNYIDFERKVFVQKVGEVDMGTLSWSYRLSNNRHMFSSFINGMQRQISPNIPINAISADYKTVTSNKTWVDRDMAYNSTSIGAVLIEIVDNRYTDTETFRQVVSGKKLIYALETPIETDISAYLTDDNFIEIEAGGTIKAVNKYELDAPTTIAYVSQKGS